MDLIDLIPDYQPDFGARTPVHFTITQEQTSEKD